MAQIETWLNQDMMQAVKVRYLDGNLFSQDNAGNLIGVKLTRDGEDYSGGGTVSANVIRADGGTVAVTGALSGNVATVVLPQSAYAVPGVVSIVVKLTVSGAIITIAAVVANIYQSSTETAIDPGTIIPSIQTLINQINTAVASIPADYSSLWETLAPAFSTSTAYTIGQYVTYDGGLYRFTSAHPAGAWSSSDTTAAVVGNVFTDLQTGKADKTDPVFYGTISKGRKGNSQAGTGSVALGDNVTANGWFSQAEGQGTIANGSYQRASGKYNVADTGNTYAEMVGNGYAEVDPQTFVVTEHRSNARTLDWNGNETLAGDLTVNKGTANEVTLGSEVSNLKNAIEVLEPSATSADVGKMLKVKTVEDGKVTEYEFGECTVNPDHISMSMVTEQETLTVTFDDGKYVEKYYTTGSNANMSIMDVAVSDFNTDAISIEYTTYDGSGSSTRAQFVLDDGSVEVVTPSYTKISTRLYVCTCSVPSGAVAFRTTIYTSEKSNCYVKANIPVTYSPLWIDLPTESVKKDDVSGETTKSRTALSVTYEDGYATYYSGTPANVTGFSNHQANQNLSTAVLSGITPLSLYEIDSYYNVSLSAGGIVVWYDSNGNRITDENGIPYNYVLKTNWVKKPSEGHFRQIVMSPLEAYSAKIVIQLSKKSDCIFNTLSLTTKTLDWLSVGIRNLDSQCIDILSKNTIDQIKSKSYEYESTVNKAVSVYGKTVALFGDSIAAGVASGTTDSGFISWANLFKQRLNLTLSNNAVSGKTITNDNSDSNSISAKVIAYDGTAEIIIIAGGTNDYNQGKTIGSITDNTAATFYGALNLMAAHLKTLAAELVVFITPINCTVKYNNAVAALDDYRRAIQDVCRVNGFSVIEGADFGFPEDAGTMQVLLDYDGLHPTQIGHVMYANEVCSYLFAKEAGGSGGSILPYTSNPAMNGTASPGTSDNYARGNHVHPSDTSKITAPASPETGAFLVYNGSAWVAQTLSVWQGGSY